MPEMYISIPIETLQLDSIVNFDIFLRIINEEVLYREENLHFGDEEKNRLIENKVKEVLIRSLDKKKYQSYLENHIENIVADKSITVKKKTEIVYYSAKNIVFDVLDHPRSGDNIKRAGRIISNTMELILSDESAFGHLVSVTSYDYYTYTHSVNVGLFAIALANKLNIYNRNDIHTLGWGAILHDVGKTKIRSNIINKKGVLADEEFEQIKKHPEYGAEILKGTGILPEKSYLAVLEHHEKADGSGYPRGITLEKISTFGKITTIADVFDAITTKRSYKPAVSTTNAINIMKSLAKDHYDPYIFKVFIDLIGKVEKTKPENSY